MNNESVTLPGETPDEPSKTRLKHEMQALKAMGKRLAELKPEVLAELPLSERLLQALEEVSRIKSHNARKRHFGFIGKLMRDQDIDVIQAFLDRRDSQHQSHISFFHQIEEWRDRLTGENASGALTAFLTEYPEADIQHLRQLLRNVQKEAKEAKPPASSRKLFRYVREILESTTKY